MKDPEAGRKMKEFQGDVAINCHLTAPGLSPT